MMKCPNCNCSVIESLQSDRIYGCENRSCLASYWFFEGVVYLVPNLVSHPRTNSESFVFARSDYDCTWFNGPAIIISRLNSNFDYLVRDMENGLPKVIDSESQNNLKRYEFLNRQLLPYGLKTQRLSPTNHPRGNDPFIVHRIDQNPLDSLFSEYTTFSDTFAEPEIVDARWNSWANMLNNDLNNIGIKINSQQLKPEQNRALHELLEKPASLVIGALPTGFGKTRIIQIAANLLNHGSTDGLNQSIGDEGPVLIISPLISLRDDQRQKWIEYNEDLLPGITKLRCEFLTSTHDRRDEDVLKLLHNGEVDVLCCSPEILMSVSVKTNKWIECFQVMPRPFSMMVIDEAHVVGDWGASIIPQFQLLPMIKDQLRYRNPNLRLLLLSATISVNEEEELIRLFKEGMRLAELVDDSHAIRITKARLGLSFDISAPVAVKNNDIELDEESKTNVEKIVGLMNTKKANIPGRWSQRGDGSYFFTGTKPPMILYTPTKKSVAIISKILKQRRISYGTYTGSTGSIQRKKILDKFTNNQLGWIVATSAFGMGVDKEDIWVVGYLGMPHGLKDLYQSFGRAARYDDWKYYGKKKNGYCIAILEGKIPSFKPRMALPLTTERIVRTMSSNRSIFTSNGYWILDASIVREPLWTSLVSANDAERKKQELIKESEDEVEGYHTEFGNHELHQQIRGQRMDEDFAKIEKERRSEIASIQSKDSLLMWAISCLQRSGAIKVWGIHPKVLFTTNDGDVSLSKCLEEGGYFSVLENLRDRNKLSGTTPAGQQRFIVIQMKENIESFSNLSEAIERGLKSLTERFENGNKELGRFRENIRKGKTCIRKLFAPSYGKSVEETKSCIAHLRDKEPAMPCSVCEKQLDKGSDPVEHLWSEETTLNSLYNLQIPQRQAGKIVLIKRPINPQQMLDSYIDSYRNIQGNYPKISWPPGLESSPIPLINEDGVEIARLTLDEGTVSVKYCEGCELIPWQIDDNYAYVINYIEGVAKIEWI
jgi:superfamily II DNA/RNA helicase